MHGRPDQFRITQITSQKQPNKHKHTNEIIERRKSLFGQPGSGARGIEEPSGEHVVTVRFRYIGNHQN